MSALQRFVDNLERGLLRRFSWVVVVVALSTIVIFFYWWTDRITEKALVEQMLHRETVLVREGASKIGEFFRNNENAVLFLAALPSLVDPRGPDVEQVLKERLIKLPSPVVDVIRVDGQGEVVARGSQVPGVSDVSDRDYFLWAKEKENRGWVFYSKIAIARGGPAKGQKAFALVTPLYKKDSFTGLVGIVISVPKFVEAYISPLAVTEHSSSFLVMGDEVLFTRMGEPSGGKIEELIDTYSPGQREARATVERIKRGEDGKAILVFQEPTMGRTTRLVAFAPVKLTGNGIVWSLGTAVPRQEALLFLAQFHPSQAGGVVFGLVAILVVSILFVTGMRFVQRQSFLEGFVKGRDHSALRRNPKS